MNSNINLTKVDSILGMEPAILLTATIKDASDLSEYVNGIFVNGLHRTKTIQREMLEACLGKRRMVVVAPMWNLCTIMQFLNKLKYDSSVFNLLYDVSIDQGNIFLPRGTHRWMDKSLLLFNRFNSRTPIRLYLK